MIPENGDVSFEQVKKNIKETRYLNFAKYIEEDEEEEEEIGTKSVMFDGTEINLEKSDEVTLSRTKDLLKKIQMKHKRG